MSNSLDWLMTFVCILDWVVVVFPKYGSQKIMTLTSFLMHYINTKILFITIAMQITMITTKPFS